MDDRGTDERTSVTLEPTEERGLEDRVRPRAAFIYEIVRREGQRELTRPPASLFWAGFAAGLSIAMSLVAEGALVAFLPDAAWTPLLTSFGYSVGFLIVVLGRQQLFTENTITAVLPVMANPSPRNAWRMARLWGIVLASNVLGTAVIGVFLAVAPVVPAAVDAGMVDVARHFFELDAAEMFWRGILAGWLVATMVWLLPAAEGAAVWIIALLTWLIAVIDLSHIVVGSVEASFMIARGEIGLLGAGLTFFGPTLLGNVIGGSALFAVLSYAQVREELTETDD